MGKLHRAKQRVLAKAKVKGNGEDATGTQEPPKRDKSAFKGVEEKSPWLDDLRSSLAKLGLRSKPITADGNCFFRACSDQLQGDEGNHLDLRQRVVDFIEQHPDDFAPYMEDDEDFESYCRRMRKDGTWAGLHEQVAIARLHRLELRIYQAGQPCWTIHPDFSEIPKVAPAWHLSYHDGEHYNSVRLADDYASRPPSCIPLLNGKVVAPPELSAAAASIQEKQQLQCIAQGTGCNDPLLLKNALNGAHGNVDQAIEALIERLAAECTEQEGLSQVGRPQQLEVEAEPPASPVVSSTQQLCLGHEAPTGGNVLENGDYEKGAAAQFSSPDGEAKARRSQEPHTRGIEALPEVSESVDGTTTKVDAVKQAKPRRNRACPCGSGRRFKNCCGAAKAASQRRQNQAQASFADVDTSQIDQMRSLYI